ncbi:MAG TPA: CPBP family glutamic-type intramembrane protease, partial [Pyrinomonadaceae bacterium]|nr:CPBP family glutamic-type intramembrane protease [Pyrinomonadaceae bacterium]
MTRFALEAILQVIVVIPLFVLFLKERDKNSFGKLALFAGIYGVYQIVLVLPRLIPALNIIDSRWNWEGKVFGVVFGVACYFAFRKLFAENDFVAVSQAPGTYRGPLIVATLIVVLATFVAYVTGRSEFDRETLAFQLTMPGFDEELMFRAVLLGLLMGLLREHIPFVGNPAILVSAVLFGLMHALTLDKDLSVSFEPSYLVQTGIGGYAWAWVAV